MRSYRTFAPLADAGTAVLEDGHLWLQEFVPGPVLGVSMDDSGLLTFGVGGEEFATPPPSLARAVAHVRRRFDRDRLRDGVDDVTDFVFFGIAARNEGRAYEWADVAPFLGIDIWSETEGRYAAPDVSERVFSTIGLDPLPAFRKEVPTDHFDPDGYVVPSSHWDDRPAAGVVVRNKAGPIAIHGYDSPTRDPVDDDDLESCVKGLVSPNLDRVLTELGADPRTVDVDVLAERLFAVVARVGYHRLAPQLERNPDRVRDAVGSAVRSLVRTRVTDGESSHG
ncbi:MAG: hypothetical protein ABEJ67_02350 [Halanaeroarchaeum sp.]